MVVPKSSLYTFAACGGYYIVASEKSPLILGENVIFSYNVSIFTLNHDFEDRKKYIYKSVKIGNNCWIGNSVSIMPGVELGNNVTIGANAVVTKSFPSNVVIAGNPARVIKELP
jgi:maltose O-acetyltransferase